MGANLNQTEASKGFFSGDERVNWQAIGGQLKDGQYDQAGQHLRNIAIPGQNNTPYLDHTLAAAYQICLVCRQVHAEVELHQHAHQEAVQREQELQQQLNLILELIQQYLEPDGLLAPQSHNFDKAELNESESQRDRVENGRSWWQRLRTRLEPKSSKLSEPDVFESGENEEETAVTPTSPDPKTKPDCPTLNVYCLGTFRAYINERSIDNWNGNNAKAIFKYMVVNRSRAIPVEILMDLFWRDDEPDTARRNLYQAIYLLRQALQSGTADYPYILSTNGCYGLNPELNIWLDSEAFNGHYHNGQRFDLHKNTLKAIQEYEAADTLYEGDFLAEDIYEEWPSIQRQQAQNAYQDILNRLSRHHSQQKNWAMSITYSQKLLNIDNCREDAHRGLMRAYARLNQRHLALRQFHNCAETLQGELGIHPAPQTIDLYEQIKENQFQF
jgi:DNA-binding SARP family transcriptional activator